MVSLTCRRGYDTYPSGVWSGMAMHGTMWHMRRFFGFELIGQLRCLILEAILLVHRIKK